MDRPLGHASSTLQPMHGYTLSRISRTANLLLSKCCHLSFPPNPRLGTFVRSSLVTSQASSISEIRRPQLLAKLRLSLSTLAQICPSHLRISTRKVSYLGTMKEDKDTVPISAAKGRQTSISSFFGAKPVQKAAANLEKKEHTPEAARQEAVQAEVQPDVAEKKKRGRGKAQGTPLEGKKAKAETAGNKRAGTLTAKATEASKVGETGDISLLPMDEVEVGAPAPVPEETVIPDSTVSSLQAAEGALAGVAEEDAAPKPEVKKRRRLVKASEAEGGKKVRLEEQADDKMDDGITARLPAATRADDSFLDAKNERKEEMVGEASKQTKGESKPGVVSFFTRRAPKRKASPEKVVKGALQEGGQAGENEAIEGAENVAAAAPMLEKKGPAKEASKKVDGVQAIISATELSERAKSPSPDEIDEEDAEPLLVTDAVRKSSNWPQ